VASFEQCNCDYVDYLYKWRILLLKQLHSKILFYCGNLQYMLDDNCLLSCESASS